MLTLRSPWSPRAICGPTDMRYISAIRRRPHVATTPSPPWHHRPSFSLERPRAHCECEVALDSCKRGSCSHCTISGGCRHKLPTSAPSSRSMRSWRADEGVSPRAVTPTDHVELVADDEGHQHGEVEGHELRQAHHVVERLVRGHHDQRVVSTRQRLEG